MCLSKMISTTLNSFFCLSEHDNNKFHLDLTSHIFSRSLLGIPNVIVRQYYFLQSRKRQLKIYKLCLLLLSISTINLAHAALSAQTANIIEGTSPYLTFDDGATKASNVDELLWIKLSNGVVFKPSDNTSTAALPIELPNIDETFTNIETLIPLGQSSVTLNSLIGYPYNYWDDDDGDQLSNVTGNLSIEIQDVNGNSVNQSDNLSMCHAPYTLTLTSTAGSLNTQYGMPASSTFSATTTTYYIQPKIAAPYACFAKPNLLYEKDKAGLDVDPKHWDLGKGFKLQNINKPSANFPTTGSNNLFFDLTIVGANGASVLNSSGDGGGTVNPISGSGIKLRLKVAPNGSDTDVIRVTLDGPSQSSKGGAFSPSTFVLYSGSTKLYTFEVSKWFIAQVGQSGGYTYTQDFCKNLGPNENYYHVPSIFDYTNSSWPSMGWTGPVNQINYRRAIGGGLFAEWGNTANTYYTNSDWVEMNYWGVESINNGEGPQFISNSRYGFVISMPPDSRFIMGACVTP